MQGGRVRERRWASLGMALGVVVLLVAGWRGVLRLSPRGHSSEEPSLARLLEHVGKVAVEPRPLGTAAHDRARDYIIEQLRKVGLQPEVQRATAVIGRPPLVYVAEVENIVARIDGGADSGIDGGAAATPAVLVASHYDSALTSPGAGDDGAGVAVMLELARVLRERPQPGNPVILLFSDGEERGLLGARTFVQSHPLAKQVAATINLEARGSGGRPVLIELGGTASRLLELLEESGASVMLGSYVTDGYRRSGNDTDFSVFREANWPGYNVAFFGDPASYHTARDTVARLDPETLAALATAAVRLTRGLIGASLASLAAPQDAVYAAGPAGQVISYSSAWALPLALLALLACVVLVALARRRLRPRGVAVATAALLASLLAAMAAVALANALVSRVVGVTAVRWEQGDGFLVSALLLAAAVVAAGVSLASRWCQPSELFAGFGALLAALAVASSVVLPSASLLVFVPALSAAVALAAELRWPRSSSYCRVLSSLPAAVLWGEAAALLAIGLGVRALVALSLLGALAALLLMTVAPAAVAVLRWRAATALLAASAAAGVVGVSRAGTDETHPATDHLVLAVDLDAGAARWATFDQQLDAWTRQRIAAAEPADLRSFFGGRATPALTSAATSAAALPSWGASTVERVGDARTLELRLVPAPGVTTVRLDVYSSATVRAASVGGQALPVPPPPDDPALSRLSLIYLHPPSGGAVVSLTLSEPAEVTVVLVDIRQGALVGLVPPRPASLIPGSRWPTDAALLRRSMRFGAAQGGPT